MSILETARRVNVDPESTDPASRNRVAAGNAVLAAIAASDALCFRFLEERARGQDHREAVDLLEQVAFGAGTAAARARRAHDLGRAIAAALGVKDNAHYGTTLIGAAEVQRVIRAADKLVAAATDAGL